MRISASSFARDLSFSKECFPTTCRVNRTYTLKIDAKSYEILLGCAERCDSAAYWR